MRIEALYQPEENGVYRKCQRYSLPALAEAATALAYAGYTVYSTQHDRPQSDNNRHWGYFSHRHGMTVRLPVLRLEEKHPSHMHYFAVNGHLTMHVATSTLSPYPGSKSHRADGEAVYEVSFDHESRREYGRGAIRRLGGIPALGEAANVVLRGYSISDSCPSLRDDTPPVQGETAAALRGWLQSERSVYAPARRKAATVEREAAAREAGQPTSRMEVLKVLFAGIGR